MAPSGNSSLSEHKLILKLHNNDHIPGGRKNSSAPCGHWNLPKNNNKNTQNWWFLISPIATSNKLSATDFSATEAPPEAGEGTLRVDAIVVLQSNTLN